jgi:hypothetical protein
MHNIKQAESIINEAQRGLNLSQGGLSDHMVLMIVRQGGWSFCTEFIHL